MRATDLEGRTVSTGTPVGKPPQGDQVHRDRAAMQRRWFADGGTAR
jgi:hypothetical protein